MAPSKWGPLRLDELGFLGRGKSRHRPRNDPNLYGGPYPFIQTADVMAADPYITTYSQTYSEFGLQQSKLWQPETLCMTIAGANTARTAILKIEACFPDSIVGFIPDKSKSDLRFIKYSLDLMRHRFLSVSRGATQDNLGLDKILSFPIRAPIVEEQRRIGAILSAYDELIENSQRRIKILEAMARGLYREWFVHFRFPGHENHQCVASTLGSIPQGWAVKKLGDLLEFKKGKKPTVVFESAEAGLQRHLLIDALRGRSSKEFVSPDKLITANCDDTIMVMDGSGSSDVFIGYEGVIGSTLGRYRVLADSDVGPFGLYLFLDMNLQEIKSRNIGSAIPHANKDFINGMEVAVSAKSVMSQFEKSVAPLFSLVRSLRRKINTLRQTRDLLLPRLLSGQIEVDRMSEGIAA